MASSSVLSSSFFQTQPLPSRHQLFLLNNSTPFAKIPKKPLSFTPRAAKLPAAVEVPKVQPKLQAPFFGFTRTAEIWNSRTCMVGLVGIFIVELILNKGILQIIGVEVGKGLDLPL